MATRADRGIVAGALLLGALAVGGCGEGGIAGNLRAAGVGEPPDEFLVLPTKPLELPQNLAALPPPTPGAPNLVDYRPERDAVAGLTGRTGPAGTANGAALVARAGPAAPGIRRTLAAEDFAWRQENHGLLLERWLSPDKEALIYQAMTLDAPAEFERLRARGLQVPPAPPVVLGE